MPISDQDRPGLVDLPLVVYREQQTLRALDLQGQQQELRALRRRHNRYLHGYGIVCGLELEDKDGVVVRSGLALDGRGRELLLAEDQLIERRDIKSPRGESAVEIWLAYYQRKTGGCGGTCRIVEGARLLSSAIDPQVHAANVRRGFVFLGRAAIGTDGCLELDFGDRAGVPLVAEQVTSPGRHVCLSVGPEPSTPNRRFGLALRSSLNNPFVDRLSIDVDGNARVVGDLAVLPVRTSKPGEDPSEGQPPIVRVADSENDKSYQRGVFFSEPGIAPKEARSWRVYRVSYPAVTPPGTTVDELRFEIAHPGKQGVPREFGWTVGVGDGKKFTPRVKAAADQSLTVAGNLWVIGGLVILATPEKGTQPGGTAAELALVGNPQGLVAAITPQAASVVGNDLRVNLSLTNTGAAPFTLSGVHATVDMTKDQTTKTYFFLLEQDLVLKAGATKQVSGAQTFTGPAGPTGGRLHLNVWGVGPAGFLRYQAVQTLTIP